MHKWHDIRVLLYMFINIMRSNWGKTCMGFYYYCCYCCYCYCVSLAWKNYYFVRLLAWIRWNHLCAGNNNITKQQQQKIITKCRTKNQLKQNEKINDHKQKKMGCTQRAKKKAFRSYPEWNITATTNKMYQMKNHRICTCCIDSWQHWQQRILHLGASFFSLQWNIAACLWLKWREWVNCVRDGEWMGTSILNNIWCNWKSMAHDDKMMAQTAIIKQHTCITLDDAYQFFFAYSTRTHTYTDDHLRTQHNTTILVMIISYYVS